MILFKRVHKTFYSAGFRSYPVLHDISFSVEPGEIFGFLGPNGAGKSTLIKILLNFIQASSGELFIRNLKIGRDNFQHLIGYLPEMPCFYENLTGLETLRFAGKTSQMKESVLMDAAQKTLARLKLGHAGNMLIKAYSKGMKQRLGIAMSLIHDPEIYILDEPMSGLDPMGRKLITDVILELKERGKTVFFSSHILSDIEKLCDRIGILNKGRLLYTGSVDEIITGSQDVETSFVELIEQDEVR
ncbi:MAG: ABC transporter ATP-binding protein [Desulfobacteraceae bacterium]|nr:ABC transporter ATP-binding protein [Desulfobacteraceae bacterium]